MNQYFFSLLRYSISEKGTFPYTLTETEWKEMYRTAQKQTLTGVLMEGIKRLPKEQQPPKQILLQWFNSAEKIRKQNQRINIAAYKVSQKFAKDGFRSVILKGQGNALLYPDPMIRIPGDIDIWLDGNREDIIKYVRKYCPNEEVVYHHAEFPVMKACNIEVHFMPSWMNNFFKDYQLQSYFEKVKEEQFSHIQTLPEEAGEICIPTIEFNRVYILLHIYRHLFDEGIGLRQLLDYYYVLKQSCSEGAKQRSLFMIRKLGMERFCKAMMYIMQEVFGLEKEFLILPPSKKEGEFLLSEIMLAGNFGKWDERIQRLDKETPLHKYFRKIKRNLRFMTSYPDEVIWNPIFRLWHYFWRRKHNYLGL